MQVQRSVLAVALVGVLAAACGGTPSGTQGPGATQGGGGGGATQVPGATQGGGGGGGGGNKPAGWDQYGKASFEASDPINLSSELGFIPAASRFDSNAQTYLSFSYTGSQEILSILVTEGVTTVSYGGPAGTVIGTACTTSNLKVETTSASGSYECKDTTAFLASGASVTGVTLKGTFNAHG